MKQQLHPVQLINLFQTMFVQIVQQDFIELKEILLQWMIHYVGIQNVLG